MGASALMGCRISPKKAPISPNQHSNKELKSKAVVKEESPLKVPPRDLKNIPEPGLELFRPLPLRESKQRLKEIFLEGVADLEAEGMVEATIQEQKEQVEGMGKK